MPANRAAPRRIVPGITAPASSAPLRHWRWDVPDALVRQEPRRDPAPGMTTTLPYDEHEDLEYMTDPELIDEKFGDIVDLVIDGGIGGIEPSTVVKCRELEDILNKLIASTRSPRGRFSAASSYPQLEKKLNFRNRRLYLTRTFG